MALRVRRDVYGVDTGIQIGEIGSSSALVSRLTGYTVQRNKAIVGANAFAHEAGIHQDGVLKDVATYQIMDPVELGLTMTLPLGKHSGRHAFAKACSDAGIDLSREEVNRAFARFKELADTRKAVTLHGPVSEMGHYDEDQWQLFNTDKDRAEAHDLAAKYPQKLEQLKALWLNDDDFTTADFQAMRTPIVKRMKER